MRQIGKAAARSAAVRFDAEAESGRALRAIREAPHFRRRISTSPGRERNPEFMDKSIGRAYNSGRGDSGKKRTDVRRRKRV
ncbi:hypothetical protein CDO73_22530 [Saccharibacillus sp. O23]|nr:hypothetical protein CDO73_22530 [Saccharibacillus sp. O23]